MKLISITTHALDKNKKIISTSKCVFKKSRPIFSSCFSQDVFSFREVRSIIKEHIRMQEGIELFSVIVSTTKGKFIQGYYPDAIKDSP